MELLLKRVVFAFLRGLDINFTMREVSEFEKVMELST